jgi:transposase
MPGPKTKSKWKDEFVSQVGILTHEGMTVKKVADFFGVSTETMYEWKRTNRKFFDSMTRAQDDYNSGKQTIPK